MADESLHYRKGTTILIKTDDNFVFLLAKSNIKQQILRFLKIYDGLLQVDN
jgi:hypothetical protein